MLLAIDMGNTQTALGLFDQDQLLQSWRMPTDRTFTKDEILVRLLGYFQMSGLALSCVGTICFAGVVPQLTREWRAVATQLGVRMIQVGPDTQMVTKVDAPNPAEVGADRIANAVADVVDPRGYYIGGAIAPGIRISMDALTARAAKLSSISLEAPQHTIGRNTVEAVRSGTVVGAAAMAEGLVARIKDELGEPGAHVIATGGLAGLVAACTNVFDVIDQQLTLKGICEICRRLQA